MATIDSITKLQQKLEAKKAELINDQLSSNDPVELLKANANLPDFDKKKQIDKKSFFVDPYDFQQSFEFKDKPTHMSYHMLRKMGKTPIINSIIKTRLSQVTNFTEPQNNKHTLGYIIEKKKSLDWDGSKISRQEEREIAFLTDFIENCGDSNNFLSDDFDTFVRKFVQDSLVLDQGTFEIVRDRKGQPFEFFAVDSSTFRVADSYFDEDYEKNKESAMTNRQEILGYYPSHVQVLDNQVASEFYPWELCFGVRNPSTSIMNNGYGVSELEEMVTVITSLLWGEEYNRTFFKNGSAPKGLFKVKNVNEGKLQAFRQQWNATMRGVSNSWKTPMLEADTVEWIDLHKNNRDMEYSQWIEFLIKVSCAIYTIDPAEVNFPLQGSASGGGGMFEGSNEQRLKHSKDKGLFPLLKFIRKKVNKFIVSQFFEGKYTFRFVGMDAMSPDEELDFDTKLVTNGGMSLQDFFKKYNDRDIDLEEDIILSPTYIQYKQMEQQSEMFNNDPVEGEEFEEEENPISKALENYLEKF